MGAMPSPSLAGKVALVTGGARRVGKAIALALADRGADIVLHCNSGVTEAESTVAEIAARGRRVVLVQADLAIAEAIPGLAERAASVFGALDILVNSAAIMERTPIGDVSLDAWERMFAINLRAPFFLAQAVVPALRAREGCIVNIADLAAYETWPAYVPHSITKAGVVQMTRGLARALAPDIRVNGVAPGAVLLPDDWDTSTANRLVSTTPLARLGSAEDVAHAVCFLCEASYITGDVVIVDGGRHVRT
jgi:pteridine reductase